MFITGIVSAGGISCGRHSSRRWERREIHAIPAVIQQSKTPRVIAMIIDGFNPSEGFELPEMVMDGGYDATEEVNGPNNGPSSLNVVLI